MMNIVKDIEIFVPTVEDWHPSFHLTTPYQASLGEYDKGLHARVHIFPYPNRKLFRICITGADDTRMEQDFTSEAKALAAFDNILSSLPLSYEILKNLGFSFQ